MKHEPRLAKKLHTKYHEILMETKAKSVEIELIREIMINFREFSEAYETAIKKLD